MLSGSIVEPRGQSCVEHEARFLACTFANGSTNARRTGCTICDRLLGQFAETTVKESLNEISMLVR